jgi:hypothetical protein
MKQNKKSFSFNSIVICSLIISVVSISSANAAGKGPPNSQGRIAWCLSKMTDCIDDIADACQGYIEGSINGRLCESSETTTCDNAYGGASDCETRAKVSDGFNQPALDVPDAYIAPDNSGGNDFRTNPLAPNSGFVIAPPINNKGKPGLPTKLNAPLVVPVKKAMPTIPKPKIKIMRTPAAQLKQRVEAPVKSRVEIPIKHKAIAAPTKMKEIKNKVKQPNIRDLKQAPMNKSEIVKPGASMQNFDEADAIFSKRTGVKNAK